MRCQPATRLSSQRDIPQFPGYLQRGSTQSACIAMPRGEARRGFVQSARGRLPVAKIGVRVPHPLGPAGCECVTREGDGAACTACDPWDRDFTGSGAIAAPVRVTADAIAAGLPRRLFRGGRDAASPGRPPGDSHQDRIAEATAGTGEWPVILVGVAGFEPAASSSRTSGASGRLAVIPARSVCR